MTGVSSSLVLMLILLSSLLNFLFFLVIIYSQHTILGLGYHFASSDNGVVLVVKCGFGCPDLHQSISILFGFFLLATYVTRRDEDGTKALIPNL